MKKAIAMFLAELMVVLPLANTMLAQPVDAKTTASGSPATADSARGYYDGYVDGRASAREHYSGLGWFAGGVGFGFVLGLIGTGTWVAMSQSGDVDPPGYEMMRVRSLNDEYKNGFLQGYDSKAKNKRLWMSLGGGLIGTAGVVALLLSLQQH